MEMHVGVKGIDAAIRELERKQKRVTPIVRGALNATATKTRTERFVKPLSRYLVAKNTRQAIRLRRADRRELAARLVPSGKSVPVANYKQWGFENAGHPTRARIWVMGPDGRKTAAGFVNPASAHQLPLATWYNRLSKGQVTRHSRQNLQPAPGLSVAYWFRRLMTVPTLVWTRDYVQKELMRRMEKELNK